MLNETGWVTLDVNWAVLALKWVVPKCLDVVQVADLFVHMQKVSV